MNITTVKRVGFLATGSELTTGEILNTNVQFMAQSLLEHGVEIGEHVLVDDRENNIISALDYLLTNHDAVIISGGLGPTSDDRTRFALSRFVDQELVFHTPSWQRIVERLTKRNIPIPENNRQQALFPESATVFPNLFGTADGCYLPFGNKHIFMLPGPPRECLPLFTECVLPILDTHQFYTNRSLYRWRLMGVSESAIAEELEAIGKPFNLEFAYRAAYPYTDIKLMLEHNAELDNIISLINSALQPYLITTGNAPISSVLKARLDQSTIVLTIVDNASNGLIMAGLMSPGTRLNLTAANQASDQHCLIINGLKEYWDTATQANTTEIHVELIHAGISTKSSRQIYLRGQETMDYAIEFTCHEIMKAWFA
ncbi:MAG: competence/damage-inducible protein A [Gammaproteobacteria bacterium]|nr:competence/damage-inducible protein A [Gammaproteobacteria bacterium]